MDLKRVGRHGELAQMLKEELSGFGAKDIELVVDETESDDDYKVYDLMANVSEEDAQRLMQISGALVRGYRRAEEKYTK